MNIQRRLFATALLISSTALAQTTTQAPSATQKDQRHPTGRVEQKHEDRGSRLFRQNCSRCHNAPESFSPSISDTVLRHMSVRASLSMRDKADLLRFLNP